jgi:CheY-like chemotaxis protein
MDSILVVEDEELILDLVTEVLEIAGEPRSYDIGVRRTAVSKPENPDCDSVKGACYANTC